MPHVAPNRKSARLGLDTLEPREVPAAGVYLADGGRTLVVSGTDAPDAVTVAVNDAAGAVTVTGVGSAAAVFPAARVAAVSAALRGGDDRFEFKTVGEVRQARQLRIDGGAGDDTILIRWADDGSTARAGLEAVVRGGEGSDAVGFRVGSLAAGVAVALRADGGAGDDALGVQSLAPGRGAKLDVALRGGDGNDTLGTYSTGDLAAGGVLNYDLAGNAGDDSISLNAAGRVAGSITARLDGGAGNDQIALNAVGVTGPNRLRATLLGGSGDDQLAALATAATAEVTVDGGTGTDAGLLFDGAKARGVEQSRPPTSYELRTGPLPAFNPALPTRTLQRDGRTVEYYSAGVSKPGEPVVVLLTGFGGDIDYWQTVPGALAAKGQVIAVNRPGYGRSAAASGGYAQTAVEDIRAVLRAAAKDRPVILVGHSLGGLYADLFARLHPAEVAGVVFVDATAPEVVARVDAAGIPFGGLGDPNSPELRLEPPGVRQEVEGVVPLARQVLAAGAFPEVPVVSLRAGPVDLLAGDPEADTWYEALGALGTPGETRRVPDSGHNVQYDRPDAVVSAVVDVRARVGTSADSLFVSGVLADVAKKYGIPGLSAAVVAGDRVVVGGAGVRQTGGTDPVLAGDRFANGSTTKAMTSTLAGVLVEKGLIRWDSTVVQVFPELKGKIRPELEAATLETFLRHRSGLIGGSADDSSPALIEKATALAGSPPDAARRDILAALLNEPLAVKPGDFYYSNAGYSVAAAMLERVTGKAYEALMQKYVFDPLGMTSATFDPSGDVGGHTPVGTDPASGKPVTFDSEHYQQADPPILNPAGVGLRMTVADWAKFVRVHLGQTVNGVRLLRPETLARLHTADPRPLQAGLETSSEGYASGWGTRAANWNGRDPSLGASLEHDGSDGYWLAEVEAFPAANFAVLVMANSTLDKAGQDLEATAFAEIKQRLTARFAPKAAGVAAQLRAAVAKARADVNLPAVSAGVILNGKVVALETTGVRRQGDPTPAAAADPFYLSSNGKAITATVAGLLVEAGAIRWDTTVAQAFPHLAARMYPAYRDVTLEDLLNHRGGFADPAFEDADLTARMQAFQGTGAAGRSRFLPELLQSKPAGPRGEWVYSNTGYVVAAAMLEKATGLSFERLTERLVFGPLGITSGQFGVPGLGVQAGKQPGGHDPAGPADDAGRANFLRLVSPSGGIAMSGTDWAKFLQAHLGQVVNGGRLLSDRLLTKLHTPDPRPLTEDGLTFRNGFGWNTTDTPAGRVLFHSGHVGTWTSSAVLLPATGLAVFAVTNKGGGAADPDPPVPDRIDALVRDLALSLAGG